MTDLPPKGDLIFHQTSEGKLGIEVLYEAETFWLSQKRIAELFGVERKRNGDVASLLSGPPRHARPMRKEFPRPHPASTRKTKVPDTIVP